MAEFKYEIIKELGILSESPTGWTTELSYISWNDREPKYDIRDWAPGKEKMGKGISLDRDEAEALKELLIKIL